MFLKLLKYEFQSIGKWYLLANLILIFGAPILGAIEKQTSESNIYSHTNPVLQLLLGLVFLAFFVLMVFSFFATLFIVVVRRFYQNIFEQEGYLTLTLPISSHQLILSKLVSSIILFISDFIIVSLSIFLFFLPIIGFDKIMSELPIVYYQLSILLVKIGLDNPFLLITAILISMTSNILFYYLAASLGQLFSNRRGLLGVVFYFLILLFFSFINAFLSPFGIDSNNIIANIIYAVIAYIATNYIISKKLNIQ